MADNQASEADWILRAKIMRAFYNRDFDRAFALLEHGHNLPLTRRPGREDRPLLHMAIWLVSQERSDETVRRQGLRCIERLLDLGLDPYQENFDGDNALHRAVSVTGLNPDIIELLLKHRVDVHRPNAYGKTVFDLTRAPAQLKVLKQYAGPARQPPPAPTVDELVDRLQRLAERLGQTTTGIEVAEIDELERSLDIQLPHAVRTYLTRIGDGVGLLSATWPYWIVDWNDLQPALHSATKASSDPQSVHLAVREAIIPNDEYTAQIPLDRFLIGGCDHQTQFYLAVHCNGDDDAPVEMFYPDFEAQGEQYDDDYEGLYPLRSELSEPSFWALFRDALTRKELQAEHKLADEPAFDELEARRHPASDAFERKQPPKAKGPSKYILVSGGVVVLAGMLDIAILWLFVDPWPPLEIRGRDLAAAMLGSFGVTLGVMLMICSYIPAAVTELTPRPGKQLGPRDMPWYAWVTIAIGLAGGIALLLWKP